MWLSEKGGEMKYWESWWEGMQEKRRSKTNLTRGAFGNGPKRVLGGPSGKWVKLLKVKI